MEFYLYSLYAPWSGQTQILLHPFVGISNEGLKKVEIELGTSQTRRGRPHQTRQTTQPQNVAGTSSCVYDGRCLENRHLWFWIADDWAVERVELIEQLSDCTFIYRKSAVLIWLATCV